VSAWRKQSGHRSIVLRRGADTWTTYSAIRFDVSGENVNRIVDYIHCPWVLAAASTVSVANA